MTKGNREKLCALLESATLADLVYVLTDLDLPTHSRINKAIRNIEEVRALELEEERQSLIRNYIFDQLGLPRSGFARIEVKIKAPELIGTGPVPAYVFANATFDYKGQGLFCVVIYPNSYRIMFGLGLIQNPETDIITVKSIPTKKRHMIRDILYYVDAMRDGLPDAIYTHLLVKG